MDQQRHLTPQPDSLAAKGYRRAAEWEPHAATWLSWPHNRETWPGAFENIPRAFERLARTISEHESVHILAGGHDVFRNAELRVGDVSTVFLHDVPTNDAWIRDHGPLFLAGDGEPLLLDWQYNAWGGKYPPFDSDNGVPRAVAEATGIRRHALDVVLEGGAIDVNGTGSLLTTASCLLNPNRNPDLSQEQIEQLLADHLGVTNVLWLGGGIAGDDTDGHIDQLARFVGPNRVVTVVEQDRDNENYLPLAENRRLLESMTDEQGQPLEVIPLPLPAAKYYDSQRLPCSYANFYIANGLVVVPTFDDPADQHALGLLRELFADRTVVGLPALELVWGLGAFHCATMEQVATTPQVAANEAPD